MVGLNLLNNVFLIIPSSFFFFSSNMGNKKGNTTRLKSVWIQWTYFQNMFRKYQGIKLLSVAEKADCIWTIWTTLARLVEAWMTVRSIGSTLNNVHSNYFFKQIWQKPSRDVTKNINIFLLSLCIYTAFIVIVRARLKANVTRFDISKNYLDPC